jgi:sugar/nucleoside kinase (ribokinase family)
MIAAPTDLLVVGGLTIDRFPDGSSAPGGSVLHIARAVVPRGARLGVLTSAGPEPDARPGLAELRELAVALGSSPAQATATFRHADGPGGRLLWLERRGGAVAIAGSRLVAGARAVLLAPIAGEAVADDLAAVEAVPVRAAILQGWLRSLDEREEVRPLPLVALAADLIQGLAGFDLLVASREDLTAEADDPRAQLRALRNAFGPVPALVVTDGVEGLWLDDGAIRHLPVPRRVASASTVGAGDVLAALLAVGARRPSSLERRAAEAMRTVAQLLEARRA